MKLSVKRLTAFVLAAALVLCGQGVSAAAKTRTLGNTLKNQILGATTAEYNGRIYYSCYNANIYSVKKDGTDKQTVFTMEGGEGLDGFGQLAVYDGYVYAIFDFYGGSDSSRPHLVRFKLDGTDYKDYGYALSFGVVEGAIYYTWGMLVTDEYGNAYVESRGIYSMKADGDNPRALLKKKGAELLGVDQSFLYYRYYNPKTYQNEYYRCDSKGKDSVQLAAVDSYGGVALSGSFFYYAKDSVDSSGKWKTSIYRKNIKTGSSKKVYTFTGSIINFYVSGKQLYASTYEKGMIRVNLDTGKVKSLSKHQGAGICGVHGDLLIYRKYNLDVKDVTYIDVILAKLSSGKKIKKIGSYFTS
ncbi:MAG: DUF5050 domain-containing protein [Muribaculaceae bacterium]|nr:DUF5050 domain-containing protein [Roseburia sp.]MCM1430382.1 DUF5050 domain-containing protein [Muribaculaceae bacterium]MCM1492422.1 DUF5050 domain-containing protein [Muribaculaceae bacterium]